MRNPFLIPKANKNFNFENKSKGILDDFAVRKDIKTQTETAGRIDVINLSAANLISDLSGSNIIMSGYGQFGNVRTEQFSISDGSITPIHFNPVFYMSDVLGDISLEWNNGYLQRFAAEGSSISLDWKNSLLKNLSGSTILDWSVKGNFSGDIESDTSITAPIFSGLNLKNTPITIDASGTQNFYGLIGASNQGIVIVSCINDNETYMFRWDGAGTITAISGVLTNLTCAMNGINNALDITETSGNSKDIIINFIGG